MGGGKMSGRKAEKRYIIEWIISNGVRQTVAFSNIHKAKGYAKEWREATLRAIGTRSDELATRLKSKLGSLRLYEATLKPAEI